jgi:hypothetical protein
MNKMVKRAINTAVYAKVGGVAITAAGATPGPLGPALGAAVGGKVFKGTLKTMGGYRRRR